jgi:DNA-binding NarL/FixJ family response regulator
MQQQRIRVAIIDDHRVFAEALATRLSTEPDLEVVGTAGSSVEALELTSRSGIDVVALDLDLGGEDGLEVGRQLRDRLPDIGIVIVTGRVDDSRVAEAVQMGIRGWVGKQAPAESLLNALRGAARGETHLPAAMLTRALVSLSQSPSSSTPEIDALSNLTARELDVLRCLLEGRSRNEIGSMLHISPNTVRTHVQSILHKLNVHSALTAVAFARRAGVADLRDVDEAAPSVAPPLIPGGRSPVVMSS